MIKEDQVSLTRQRIELVATLASPLSPEERQRIQGKLAVLNAKIKALNTIAAAQLKALADQRRAAGLAEARANATRVLTRTQGLPPDMPDTNDGNDKISTMDAWIDALLLRHDVDFTRSRTGKITFGRSTEGPALLEALIAGLYTAAQGQELPELPSEPTPTNAGKPKRR